MTDSVIDDTSPLKPSTPPSEFLHRNGPQSRLSEIISRPDQMGANNVFLYGPRGTGKTHLVLQQIKSLPSDVSSCYITCDGYDTQNKVLKELYGILSGKKPPKGHHTASLKRDIQSLVRGSTSVIILDEIDFALLNDGDDLLYYLSRLNSNAKITLTILSANTPDIADAIDDRTFSSLRPTAIELEPYTGEEAYNILHHQAKEALKPRSLRREALTYIASATHNITFGLDWLRTAAKTADEVITEETVKAVAETARVKYVHSKLDVFTDHHTRLYHAIESFQETGQGSVRTGRIYDQYEDMCNSANEAPLSTRRISTYLKHLELLGLITAEYHYGGSKGKTREISLADLDPQGI